MRLGAEIVVTRSVEAITPADDCHTVTLDDGSLLGARAVILATGVSYRALQAEGLDTFAGIGVFYGAARTEAPAMQGPRGHPRRRRQLGGTGGGLLRRLRRAR